MGQLIFFLSKYNHNLFFGIKEKINIYAQIYTKFHDRQMF